MKIKFNPKLFLIIIIIASFIFVSIILILKKSKNPRLELVKFNPTEVAEMQIKLPKSAKTITITKDEENEWYVSNGEQKYNADIRVVSNYLNKLLKIKPESIVTKKRREWDKYQVSEQKAIEIKLYRSDKTELLDILIGKSTSIKPNNPLLDDVISKTCVRLSDEKTVYETDGLLQLHLNRTLDDWRNKLLVNFKTKSVQKISFIYPKENFTIYKEGSEWYLGKKILDKKKVEKYLAQTHYIYGSKFNNAFIPSADPIGKLIIKTEDSELNLECFKIDEIKYIIHSSQNEESYFESDKSHLIEKLFKSMNDFLN